MCKVYEILILVCLIVAPVFPAYGKPPPKLLILPPVSLQSGQAASQLGDNIRILFQMQRRWQVISKKEIESKYVQHLDINKPCKELSCAFDAGSALQTRYTLYSTIAIFGKYYFFSLNLVEISKNKVVWSENGEVPIKSGKNSEEALLHHIQKLIENLTPQNIIFAPVSSRGALGILNLNPNTKYSRILFERLSSQAHSSGHYNLLGQTELESTFEPLPNQLSGTEPDKEALIPLGKTLGVDFLAYSLLTKEKVDYHLKLGLFDINQNKTERMWSFKSKRFRNLLQPSESFFSDPSKPGTLPQTTTKTIATPIWKKLSIPLLVVASGAIFYHSWAKHSSADQYHAQYHQNLGAYNTSQEIYYKLHLKDLSRKERRTGYIYSILGSAIIVSSSILLFSF